MEDTAADGFPKTYHQSSPPYIPRDAGPGDPAIEFRKEELVSATLTSAWPSRRLKRFMLGENMVLDTVLRAMVPLKGFVALLDSLPFPQDARVLSVHHDPWSKAFGFTIEHESFPEVPDGCFIPAIDWGRVSFHEVRVEGEDEPVIVG